MSKAKIVNAPQLHRIVKEAILEKVRKEFGGPAQFTAIVTEIESKDRPQIEMMGTEAVRGLGRSLDRALQGYEPATNSNPNIKLEGYAGGQVLTPSSMGHAWDPLSSYTLSQKAGRKRFIRELESSRSKRRSMKGDYFFRIWRHRRAKEGLYPKMAAVLSQMRASSAKYVRVSKGPQQVKIGGRPAIRFQYALVFPAFAGEAGALINALAMRPFMEQDWNPLADPPGWAKSISNESVRAILHPERSRPLIRPLSAAAGRRLAAQLRRLRK